MKKYLARSFFFLLYQFVCTTLPKRRGRLHRAPHRGQGGHRGGVLPQGRSPAGRSSRPATARRSRSSTSATTRRSGTSTRFTARTATTSTPTTRRRSSAAKELCEVANLFGYGEIKPLGAALLRELPARTSSRRLDTDNFQTVLIERKEDVWPSFKAFLAKDRAARTR